MKFYHISFNYEEDITEFFPRVPMEAMKDENTEINRVCVSDTIIGCLKAHPTYWYEYVSCLDYEFGDVYELMQKLVITKDGVRGALARVYEFEVIEPSKLISNKELIDKNYVPDAMETGEAWITESIKPITSYHVIVYTKTLKELRCGNVKVTKIDETVEYMDAFSNEFGNGKWRTLSA